MTVTLLTGDCRELLATLPDQHFHTCVTSIPYFGLRDYGTARWEGGRPDCDHVISTGKQGKSAARSGRRHTQQRIARGRCGRCGAFRVDNQLGLEATPEAFVAEMVAVFRQVRRVLRDDGTLWLNIGDSYAGSGKGGYAGGKSGLQGGTAGQDNSRKARGAQKAADLHRRAVEAGTIARAWTPAPAGFKQKDLIGIPWMLAFALRADGWFLRQDIIWSKPNPMPESVEDRCTKAHEYLFLLSKSARYYFDQQALLEPIAAASAARLAQETDLQAGSDRVPGKTNGPMRAVSRKSGNLERKPGAARGCPEGSGSNVCGSVPWEGTVRNRRSVWPVETVPFDLNMCGACKRIYPAPAYRQLRVEKVVRDDVVVERRVHCGCGRHDAWVSHFATFPPRLIEPCILAGAPVGGAVLDPFGGACTTGLVAQRLARSATLIELNPDYVAMGEYRCRVADVGLPLGSAA